MLQRVWLFLPGVLIGSNGYFFGLVVVIFGFKILNQKVSSRVTNTQKESLSHKKATTYHKLEAYR